MKPCLCHEHFRQVSNVFDKETAFAYDLNDAECVICNKVIFIEGARRFVQNVPVNNEELRLPNTLTAVRVS